MLLTMNHTPTLKNDSQLHQQLPEIPVESTAAKSHRKLSGLLIYSHYIQA